LHLIFKFALQELMVLPRIYVTLGTRLRQLEMYISPDTTRCANRVTGNIQTR
jgi:hypothetical protein